jgi:CRP-like cAMP-binding protein
MGVKDFFSYGGAPAPAVPAPAAAPAEGDPPRAILADLEDEDWEKFIGFAARRRYPDRAPIVARGATDVALGFVASGAVRVLGEGLPVQRRAEGEAFGILGFLDGTASRVDVLAEGPTEVLLLGREALMQLAAWQPRIAVALLRDLGAHVAARLRRHDRGD